MSMVFHAGTSMRVGPSGYGGGWAQPSYAPNPYQVFTHMGNARVVSEWGFTNRYNGSAARPTVGQYYGREADNGLYRRPNHAPVAPIPYPQQEPAPSAQSYPVADPQAGIQELPPGVELGRPNNERLGAQGSGQGQAVLAEEAEPPRPGQNTAAPREKADYSQAPLGQNTKAPESRTQIHAAGPRREGEPSHSEEKIAIHKGDTLSAIAKKMGLGAGGVEILKESIDGCKDANKIFVGQSIDMNKLKAMREARAAAAPAPDEGPSAPKM